MKKVLVFCLIVCLLVPCVTSCGPLFGWPMNDLPEGYTGGFGISYGSNMEYYWVESYEECIEAIELLKSHDSTFSESIVFTYEGEFFDTKYCFKIDGHNSENIKYGENPFDRRALNVKIESYGFFEDVSIDELNFSYVSDYDVIHLSPNNNFAKSLDLEKLDEGEFVFDRLDSSRGFVLFNETHVANLERGKKESGIEMTDECVVAVIDSAEFIGFGN